jgi:hypothetical protein
MGNPSLLRIYNVDTSKQALFHKFDMILKGVTLYREKTGRKPKPYGGEYCISYTKEADLLADLFNKITGYRFCLTLKGKSSRFIKISFTNEFNVVSFHEHSGALVGPIIRVRKIVVRS